MGNTIKKSTFTLLLIISLFLFTTFVSATFTLGDTDAPELNATLVKSDPAFVERESGLLDFAARDRFTGSCFYRGRSFCRSSNQ